MQVLDSFSAILLHCDTTKLYVVVGPGMRRDDEKWGVAVSCLEAGTGYALGPRDEPEDYT